MKIPLTCFAGLLVSFLPSFAQPSPSASAFVDENGVMRWTASRAEVAQFGVNYTTPFAYAFRAQKELGIPWQKAIDADVYHMARLGFDAYRVHIWDREISDAEGNLLVNEHVQAFDYLLARLEERGIKIIITPLQFGNAGYPAPGEPLPGFSSKYGKKGCLEDKTSWPLQERYLSQFVSHVNPHTGRAYKDDPAIIAFEICNEPGHSDYALTVDYINRMVAAVRGTGCAKPIFYNMSHGLPVYQAYLDANVQGGTFQWYPANLVAGHEQRGNFLPYVDNYPIPFAADPKFRAKAKMIYEFDAADIGRAYIYPAIARTFRKAGMQFATQFAYDPLYLAPFNTEYQTHYLNLAYAPQKALGMKVAGEAFRRVPLGQDYGAFPNNTRFEGVHVSYEDDLAELATDRKFFYSNRTATPPPAPASLEEIAGYSDSPIVHYGGQGAYFLDRIEPGVWRLEVMPDAIWVRDPFEPASPKKQVVRIAWNEWPMQIDLPDLGDGFAFAGLNEGNPASGRAERQSLAVRPGVYLLTRAGLISRHSSGERFKNIALGEFVAPPASLDRAYVLHRPALEATAGQPLTIAATVATPAHVTKVDLVAYLPAPPAQTEAERFDDQAQPGRGNGPGTGGVDLRGAQIFPMKPVTGFRYEAGIPADRVHPGTLRYHIVIHSDADVVTFPSETRVEPTAWDFFGEPWTTHLVPARAPILLFDSAADTPAITAPERDFNYELLPSDRPGIFALHVLARDLAEGEHDHSFRFFFRDKIHGRTPDLPAAHQLVFYGRATTGTTFTVQLALVTADGIAYAATVPVTPAFGRYAVPIDALRPVRSPNLPHGYPVFIPFWSEPKNPPPLDLQRVESVLFSIGPGLPASGYRTPHGFLVERAWLE